MKPSSRTRGQRGSSLIEFALVLPVLLFLAFAVFDFSRAIQTNTILVNVTREGANLMSRSTDTPANAQAVMNALGDTAMPAYLGAWQNTPRCPVPAYTGSGQSGAFCQQGTILVTQITGKLNPDGRTVDAAVTEQYKWLDGGITRSSRLWACGNSQWNGGTCAVPGLPDHPPVIALQGFQGTDALNVGDVIYAVEAYYDFVPMFGGANLGMNAVVPSLDTDLYAVTMF